MGSLLQRAVRDTWKQAGNLIGLLWLIGLPSVTLVAHLLLFGRKQMMEEVPPFVSTLAAFGAAALLLFLFNLVAAPYRHEKERADKAEAARKQAENKIASGPKLRIEFVKIGWGGTATALSGYDGILLFANVINAGSAPSVARNYALRIEKEGFAPVAGIGFHADQTTVQFGNSKVGERLGPSEVLYTKTATPIPAGGMATGILTFGFPKGTITPERLPLNLVLTCEDVAGNEIEGRETLRGDANNGHIHIPQ